ncbi:hypothetical protein B296_00043185 [Ensete ventricosum]|uniref:Uncharacterized protein n=1 Tax=Ensete ventricosum TaxID=4639 RepID=A0A426XJ43_ENSVE|nr:hypothetical protein B296_00043185 [Ensete ventricosum]
MPSLLCLHCVATAAPALELAIGGHRCGRRRRPCMVVGLVVGSSPLRAGRCRLALTGWSLAVAPCGRAAGNRPLQPGRGPHSHLLLAAAPPALAALAGGLAVVDALTEGLAIVSHG